MGGLVPARAGARRAHNLAAEILARAEQALAARPRGEVALPGRSKRGSLCAHPGPSSEHWPVCLFKTHCRVSDLRIHGISYAVSARRVFAHVWKADLIVYPTWYPT